MGRIIKLFLLGVICYLLFVNRVYADTPCQPIYGGGKTCTITPTPTKAVMQKSGFPVVSPPAAISKTPATGNEALFTLALISIGILGEFLRRKSKLGTSL